MMDQTRHREKDTATRTDSSAVSRDPAGCAAWSADALRLTDRLGSGPGEIPPLHEWV